MQRYVDAVVAASLHNQAVQLALDRRRVSMALNRADQESIHKFSDHHRALLAKSDRAGCFYCEAVFAPSEIEDWVDVPDGAGEEDGVTALCPRCGIDAVLPSAAPIKLTPELLAEMHAFWF
jgi:hypothetical protein